jgi:hypothetical protein
MFFSEFLHPSPSLTFSLALQIYAHESKLVDSWVQEPNAVEQDVQVLLDHLMPTGEDHDGASSMAPAQCRRAQDDDAGQQRGAKPRRRWTRSSEQDSHKEPEQASHKGEANQPPHHNEVPQPCFFPRFSILRHH